MARPSKLKAFTGTRGVGTLDPIRNDGQGEEPAAKALDGIIFHGWGESRDVLAGGGAFNFDAQLVLVFRAGLAKHHDGAQRLGVNARDEKSFPGFQVLPKLANLNFPHGHVRQ